MADDRWFPEYRDEHAGTTYPFADGGTLKSANLLVDLVGTIIDAAVYPIGGGPRLRITSVVVANGLATIWVGVSASPQLCSATFTPAAAPALLTLFDAYGRPAGRLVCDATALATAQTWPEGVHTFAEGAAEFTASCTIAIPAVCLRGLSADGELFAGDVWLVGDDGVVLSMDDSAIRVDVVGDPLSKRRACEPLSRFETPRFLKTINGGLPDAYGEFHITSGDGGVESTILRIVTVRDDAILFAAAGRQIDG